MKKLLLGFTGMAISFTFYCQLPSINKFNVSKDIPTLEVAVPNMTQIHNEDVVRDNQGMLYRIGVAQTVNVSPLNSGLWSTLSNGNRQWQLRVHSSQAEALSFLFSTFKLYGNTTLEIRNLAGALVHPVLTSKDVESHFMYNAALCFGDDMIITLTESPNVQTSELFIDRIIYNYRSTGNVSHAKINESDACEVNVNCSPVGDNWQNQKRGVARIYVVEGASAGWCSGSLVNNVANDCKPLFLTALHCGVNCTTADFNQWKFYFRYEAPSCSNPASVGTLANYFISGSVKLADAGDGGGTTGSDFLLVQLGTVANQATTVTTLKSANFNAYWNGWDANNTATTGGVGIHHPAGDIKKISTFNGTTVSTTWGGSTPNTHWRLTWSSNSNGYGVTEGGSSGSPLFNNSAGRIIGTLTGGGSFCSAQNSPDSYGKVSYHWTSNGAAANRRLKTYLDPANTGALTLNGSSDPCSNPTPPVANFVGAPLTVNTGNNVSFTDLSTGVPTSWAWTISGSGWVYTGGTSATSQNPIVTFNNVGQYTVTLVATNALGSDSEIKTNYITVVQATGPCAAAADTCDEYIKTVLLNTINNNSGACTAGGYADYTAMSTSLAKGSAYSATITPGIIGQAGNIAYTNDELAMWIDYNNDLDFADAGEQVGYVIVAAGWSNVFNFTVPASATTGMTHMRVRISYQGAGAIVPCGTLPYGETEDYMVNITASSGLNTLNESMINVYPNPTEDALNIDLGSLNNQVSGITITDLTGKVVFTTTQFDASIVTIPVINFAKGMYHVNVTTTEGTLVKSIMKN
ncbi:MAG: T9SS C-terminal target domain-containing protein [Flavobacteriia bacterium]|nr:T9SS C-terminal target domain-containing protein [Flavobacteriia bacterium]